MEDKINADILHCMVPRHSWG